MELAIFCSFVLSVWYAHRGLSPISVGSHPRLCYITATRFCVMPPRWGSNGGICYPWVDTHGCIISPLRGSITATRFCVMPPLWGSNGGEYVIRGLTPTAVLYHRYAVLCYATPTGFEWCGYVIRGLTPTAVLYHPDGVRLPLHTIHRQLNDASNKRNFIKVI